MFLAFISEYLFKKYPASKGISSIRSLKGRDFDRDDI